MDFGLIFRELTSGLAVFSWGNALMIGVGLLLIYLAIAKEYEPVLLLPIGFGCILANIPMTGMTDRDGLLGILYEAGIATELFPLLIFIGVGAIEKRGVQKKIQYMGSQVSVDYELPLSEVVLDFFDRLKSVSRGYASFDYDFVRFQCADLVKVDVLINGERVDALSIIVHREFSRTRGQDLATKMKEIIPRQMYEVAIQAAIGSQIIARTTVKALRKNVTTKCYGGDATRKKKLLERQKAGKTRMKQVGKVEIPQADFLAVLQLGKK